MPHFHVFGVCRDQDSSLFIDYVADSPDHHRSDLLRHLRQAPHERLQAWQARGALNDADIFEIESVEGCEAAKEAVACWQAYFRSLGESIIDGGHLCDRLP